MTFTSPDPSGSPEPRSIRAATFKWFVETEPQLPAPVVISRLQAGLDLVALSLAATSIPISSEAGSDDSTYLPFEARSDDPRQVWELRSVLYCVHLSYANPLSEMLVTPVGKALSGERAAKLIETLATIGLERAERMERVKQLRMQNIIKDATLEFDIDDRVEQSTRLELENESLRLDLVRKRFLLAHEVIEAQRRMRSEDDSTEIWTLEYAMQVLDPANSGGDVVKGIRDLQSLEPTVTAEEVHVPSE